MGSPYDQSLGRLASAVDVPAQLHGSSGYFSRPTVNLDPRLFPNDSEQLLPAVRAWILHTLYSYWNQHYDAPYRWSTAWIAGSGITRQWSGGRAIGTEPGDLDVLIGVDWPHFFALNPRWQGTSSADMSEQFNTEFHAELWSHTANVVLPAGGAPFEVTFYVNATGSDIRNLRPYAAYNLQEDCWTVRPVDLPEDWNPQTHFAASWWDRVNDEAAQARDIIERYRTRRALVMSAAPGSPQWLNHLAALHEVVKRGRDLFDSIHGERHQAFGPEGAGFGDYYNFRWQAGKWLGTVGAVRQLAALDSDVHKDITAGCYNGVTLDAHHALILAQKAANRDA